MITQVGGISSSPRYDNTSIMHEISRAITVIKSNMFDPYAIMLPKATAEEIELEVRPGIPVDAGQETIYGLEIIRCSRLPYGQRFAILHE